MRPHQFGAVLLENASRAPHPRWRVTEGCTSQNGEMRESLEFPAHFLGPADLVLRRLDWRKIVSVYGIRVVLKAGISKGADRLDDSGNSEATTMVCYG